MKNNGANLETNMIEFKTASNGASGLYRIDGRGPWRNEYKTDSLLANGEYPVVASGKVVGKWIQTTTGHELKAN